MLTRLQGILPMLIAYALIVIVGFLALHWYGIVWVSGESMLPALMPGDLVIVQKDVRPGTGDIALLTPGEGLVLHRVIKADVDGRIWTRGDANPIVDLNPTAPGEVHGRVVRVLPLGSLLQRWRGIGSCDTLPVQVDSARL